MKTILAFLIVFISYYHANAQEKTKVMVMEIRDEIDPRMLRYVRLSLEHAEKMKADYVIIDMDTYGGVLTDAKEIVDLIADFKKPVWVFINSDAASAGALISIACDSIYMSPGASIGAATVVEGAGGQAAPDKYQSYMRSIMRATAEQHGRDPRIAEGMVDENMAIDSIKQAGKIITFTTTEALKFGYCEAKVNSIDEILKRNKIKDFTIETYHLSLTEKIIAFAINPFISGLLILVIIGGIYFELQSPGLGFPLFAAIFALILYLVPYYLNGLAEYWEILALFIGVILIMLEIFVIPGFGVAGIAGIGLTVVSLVLIMLNNEYFNFEFVPLGSIVRASFVAVAGIAGGVIALFAGSATLINTKAFKKMASTHTQQASHGYTANFIIEDVIGKTGITQTVLRPSGKITIEGKLYDAFSRGEFIEKDQLVEVVAIESSTLRVKAITTNNA